MIDAAALAVVGEQVRRLRELASALGIESVEQDGLVVYVRFRRRRDSREFMLRFSCDGYPIQPPAVDFVDPGSRQDTGPQVWPNDGEQGIKTQSQPRFICLPGVREYHQRHGPIQTNVHSRALPAIFQLVAQCVEARS